MPVVPHNFNYFGAFALLLKPESIGSVSIDECWDTELEEASEYLHALLHFLEDDRTVNRAAFPSPMVVQVLGGDPFLRSDDLFSLLSILPANQFLVEVCTAGLWLKETVDIAAMLDRFQGKFQVLVLDTSSALLETIGVERVEQLIIEGRKRRLGIHVRCGVSSDAPFPMQLLALEAMNDDTSITLAVPLTESLKAGTAVLSETPPLRRRCAESFVFLVTPGGDVYPCSRGAGLPDLRIGCLKTESISEILQRVRPSVSLRHLRDYGPFALYDAAR
ncbi:MAG TPA: hypothetical protein VJT50_06205, partial [Pyrinomonadaceae bacterium]|nr:hypothetical protein [Pyrinomonadaceae bacterium]